MRLWVIFDRVPIIRVKLFVYLVGEEISLPKILCKLTNRRKGKVMRKLFSFLIMLAIIATGLATLPHYAFSDNDVENLVTITTYISVFDCTHGNPIPNVRVTLSDPLTESRIKSETTDSDGNLMTWFVENLKEGEDPAKKAKNVSVELEKPGSECLVRKFDEYLLTSSEFEATIEKEFCMKGCYKDWELYENITFPSYAQHECGDLLGLSQTRKCSEFEVGKRISPVCTITWSVGEIEYRRECALICSGGYGYQHWVDLRCSEVFRKQSPEE